MKSFGAASAPDAYAVVETLAAALSHRAPGAVRPILAHLALRAALHPVLAPFRADPLAPLGERFLSLDAQVAGLLAATPYLAVSPDDQAALRLLGLSAMVPSVPLASDQDVAGTIAGALYLPSQERAAPCRVWAVYGAAWGSNIATGAWPAPVAVRPVSPDVAASAQAALVAAVQTLEVWGVTARRALPPSTIYYDVCASTLPDDVCAAVAGPSLGMPLTLAFLSALLQLPLPLTLAATGEVGGRDGASVLSVEAVSQKAECLRTVASLFLVPAVPKKAPDPAPDTCGALPELRGVESVTTAARIAAPAFAKLFALDAAPTAVQIAPPVGEQVAFVVAGIEDAFAFLEACGGDTTATFGAYDRLATATLAQHGGYVLSQRRGTTGEAICAAFANAQSACLTAVALLLALRAHVWPPNAPVPPVRVGVHSGLSPYLGGGVSTAGQGGATLNRAILLMEAARGGQILVSGAVADEVSDAEETDAADALHIRAHGAFRLPDLAEPLRIAQVWALGLADVRDTPRGLDARRHNLPVQANPALWGRDEDAARVADLLTQTRLLTLTGPGGVGKTRLALHAAAQNLDRFPGGVWLVSVGEAATEAEIISALADALGAGGGANGSQETRVYNALARAPGPTLLVLDECEASSNAAAAVTARLLQNAPTVTVLATGQAPLLLAAEQRFDVAPLLPPSSDAPVDAVRAAPVVALFTERARAVSPGWTPSDADVVSIRLICELLDGLPLAIELAAARVRQMTPPEIEARLGDALSLLTSRLRDASPRHRAIEAALSWSWGLLDADEQTALARLSIFGPSGFTREAGCAVVATGDLSPLFASDLLDGLEEKSLLTLSPPSDNGRRRFGLRNLVRAFADRRLRETNDSKKVCAVHAAFFVDLAAQVGQAGSADNEVAAFDALDAEMDNLRIAFVHVRENDRPLLPSFVASLTDFLRRRGHRAERAQWTNDALAAGENSEADNAATAGLRGRLLCVRGVDYKDANRLDAAERDARDGLALGRQYGDDRLTGEALNLLGILHTAAERYEEAIACHEEAQNAFRAAGWAHGEAAALFNIALALLRSGKRAEAQTAYEQSIARYRASGDRYGLAYSLNNLAHIAQENNDLARARALFSESLLLFHAIKETTEVAVALANLGEVMDAQGDSHDAAPLLVAGEEILARLAHRHRGEVAKYVERCAARVGEERVAALRAEAARRTLSALVATPPPPAPRHLDTR